LINDPPAPAFNSDELIVPPAIGNVPDVTVNCVGDVTVATNQHGYTASSNVYVTDRRCGGTRRVVPPADTLAYSSDNNVVGDKFGHKTIAGITGDTMPPENSHKSVNPDNDTANAPHMFNCVNGAKSAYTDCVNTIGCDTFGGKKSGGDAVAVNVCGVIDVFTETTVNVVGGSATRITPINETPGAGEDPLDIVKIPVESL